MPKKEAQTIKLGVMPPLTGLVGIYGTEISRAAQIACQEINEAGGVLGRPLELVIEDDGSLPESAVAAAEKLVTRHGCVAIIGNLLSNSRISVAYRVAEPHHTPYLNFSFYEGSILSRYFFHFAALPNQQIDRMIPYMKEKYGPRMYFAGNNYEWPRGSVDAAKQALTRAGGVVVGEEYTPIGVDAKTMEELLDHVEAAAPDVFVPYFAGADQVNLLTRFTERGLKKKMAVVMGHYDELMASKLSPEVREGFYSSNTYFMSVDTPENRRYLQRLEKFPGVNGIWPAGNGILTNFGEGTYLCVRAFAQAANAAGSTDADALIDQLNSIKISGPQGVVQMDPISQHAKVNTYLTRCNREGVFEMVERFGSLAPIMPERYGHQRVAVRATMEEDIRLQARMLEQMSEGVMLIDSRSQRIIYANSGAEKMFGYEAGGLLGLLRTDMDMPSAGVQNGNSPDIAEILLNQGSWQGELLKNRKDGTPIWCSASFSTFTHPLHGEVWMGVYNNISSRKQAESNLAVSEERLRQVIEATNDGVWDWNPVTHEDYLSPRWKAILGYADHELKNEDSTFFSMIHPDDQDVAVKAVYRHFEMNEPYRVEIRMLHKDGNYRWIYSRGEAIRDEQGKPIRMVGTITDITERKRSEEELRQHREHLEDLVYERTAELSAERNFVSTILDTAGALVVVLDSSGKIVRFNRACEATTGYPAEEMQGTYLWDKLLPAEMRAMVKNVFSNLDKSALPGTFQNAWITRSGESRLISWANSLLLSSVGAIDFVVSIGIDITEKHRAEQELIAAKETAERANRANSEFLSRMSHELRTPMNAILGFAQVLEMEDLPVDQVEFVKEIHRAGDHLLELINELLDLSRIEAGKLATVLQPVELKAVTLDAIQIVQTLVTERRVSLVNQCVEQAVVLADPTRLKQILVNLLTNAAKYNRIGGQINLACQPVENNWLRISVTDTGRGIAPEKLGRLFKPFERLGEELGEIEGTGIGLALSRQLAELMGGKIGVDSLPGKGSTFWLDLPLAEPQTAKGKADKAAEQTADEAHRLNVLYVEDNAANLRVVEAMFRHQPGLRLLSATNGEFGLELARRYKPDVILLDIHLPGMDGYAVLEALRADPGTCDIPVIALSADAMPIDIEQGLKAGFVHYLTKPVRADDLVSSILHHAEQRSAKNAKIG